MLRRLRLFTAVLGTAGLLLASTQPASAGTLEDIDSQSVPPMVDLALLRPLGLAVTAVGAVAFVPAGAATALFAPDEMDKPFDFLVRRPFDYTFRDPLGSHGNPSEEYGGRAGPAARGAHEGQ